MIRDNAVFDSIEQEFSRQSLHIELIASENIVSRAVLEAQGSILTNKYAEGYPGGRYYAGCEHVDVIEKLAQERACELFDCKFANVQPHSGSQANQAVLLATLVPGDTILGMELNAGGHLTHGHRVSVSGKWFNAIHYDVNSETHLIDMQQVRDLARKHHPKLIICGASAYTQEINFQEFRAIADEVGAILLADIAHYAGLIATQEYPGPFPYAHIATSTTHKTLRGPRGGLILTNEEALYKKINSAVFPGLQGGPLMHAIAGKAVAFGEALQPEFHEYIKQVKQNMVTMSNILQNHGITVLSGGTKCHMLIIDLRHQNVTGKSVEEKLEEIGIICNKNSIPNDTTNPCITSGIRIGTPAITSRGLKEVECMKIANMIAEIIQALSHQQSINITKYQEAVKAICLQHPIYQN